MVDRISWARWPALCVLCVLCGFVPMRLQAQEKPAARHADAVAAMSAAPSAGGVAVRKGGNRGVVRIAQPGFQLLEGGGSRIFVLADGEFDAQLERGTHELRVLLGPAVLANANAARPLDTRYFAAPVNRLHIDRRAGRAYLVVALREGAKEPSVSMQRAADGQYVLTLDFPAVGKGVVPATVTTETEVTSRAAAIRPQSSEAARPTPAPVPAEQPVKRQNTFAGRAGVRLGQ